MKPVLAALGITNALGNDKAAVLANLLAGHAPGMQPQAGWLPGDVAWVGSVSDDLPAIPQALATFDCRNSRLLLAALAQIDNDIAQAMARYGRERIGVVIGSSTSGIAEGEMALAAKIRDDRWPPHYDYRQQEIGSPAEFVARYLGLDGIALTISTACSSSAKALGSARQLLAIGACDAVVCGGADSLCRLTVNGFSALESVSPARCEPFASGRNGINIGEGAALFLMTRDGDGIRLAGIGESADAHHISAPQPGGLGAEAAMRTALHDAGITAADISYINLHGTATPLNDAMESAAVARVFGCDTPCSSTKPLTGHTLGAAGATEVALCWLLLCAMNDDRTLPAQVNRLALDPALPPIAILRTAQRMPQTAAIRMLSNSFAFGGSNAAVILEATA